MRLNEFCKDFLQEYIEPEKAKEIATKVINNWVGEPPGSRDALPKAWFVALMRAYPDLKYFGSMFRAVQLDDDLFYNGNILDPDVYYNWREPTEKDFERVRGDFYSPAPDEIIKVGELIKNGQKKYDANLRKAIYQHDRGGYVAWAESLEGVQAFHKFVSKSIRDAPVQFQDMPVPPTVTIKQKNVGFKLYELRDFGTSDKKRELEQTKEILSNTTKNFQILHPEEDYDEKENYLEPIIYETDPYEPDVEG